MSTAEALGAREPVLQAFAEDVRSGLCRAGQKQLKARWLYDDVGSALFDVITLLPEYGLTRASERLFSVSADAIAERLAAGGAVADLGSGSARRVRALLEALSGHAGRGAGEGRRVAYHPIDVSRRALDRAACELAVLDGLEVAPIEASYLDGLALARSRHREPAPLLALFLGGTIGNFDRTEAITFLRAVAGSLREGDLFLLEADLMKPVPELLLAYDDPLGVTAAFDLNLLARIDRELGADFDLRLFRHEARWDDGERRIEMHLRATEHQVVRIEALRLRVDLRAGESIWTESSHRFTAAELVAMGERAGFRRLAQWIDPAWPFAQTLFERTAEPPFVLQSRPPLRRAVSDRRSPA